MKNKFFVLSLAALLTAACATTRHADTPPVQNLPAEEQSAQAQYTGAQTPQAVARPATDSAPSQPDEPALTAKQPAEPAEKSVQSATASAQVTQEPVPPAEEPAQASSQPQPAPDLATQAQTLIGQARAAQTLPAPQADHISFEDEELIPLEGRRLSPMAYEPAVQAAAQVPWSGEELKYGVYYTFIKAGTAYIKNRGLTTVNGRPAYLLQTTAFSASVIDAFFKVRDVNYSWIDAENFYSLGYTQSVREGSYIRDEWLTFDYPRGLFYGEIQKKEEPRVISGPLSIRVLDMLSSLYFVRAQKLQIGQDIVFDIINRERQYPLVVKVLGKETVKTKAGKFDCIVVEPQFRGEGIFVSKGKSLKVWLTDDEYKMPVKMKAEVFIGSVSAELLEYKRN